jgi:hypothetical protein
MSRDWQALTKLTGGALLEIERVRLVDTQRAAAHPDIAGIAGIVIEGRFELPPLARLTAEDQVFVAAFVRCHGSIKQMEQFFGVSYPTIKNRLNRIGAQLPFVEVEAVASKASDADELLTRLERGEVTVRDVITRLAATSKKEAS